MRRLSFNILWAIAALAAISLLFSSFMGGGGTATELTLNELATKVSAGGVQKIVVQGDELAITLTDQTEAHSKKEPGVSVSETLASYGVSPETLRAVSLEVRDPSGAEFWLSLIIPALLPAFIILAIFYFMMRQARQGATQAFSFGRSNIKLFGSPKRRITFKDVAGLKEAKRELEEVVDFLKNPKKYLDIGARIPRGVLLMGPPGTGKTMLAQATAGESNVPFFHISASEFVEMFVGVGASRTRDAFAVAKKAAPSILFIDEIDAVGRERGAGLGGGHDEREQTLNQILVEMDGFERDTKTIIIAATNRPDVLDSALLRPGRFDRRVVLDLPDIKDREEILKIHGRGKKLAQDIDFHRVAVRTPGFSGADLANLVNEAAILAASKNQKQIAQDDLYHSVEKVLLGPERRGRIVSDREKRLTAYHEAGHAVIGASLKDSDPVHKVSIVSRGRAGGYTLKLPLEDVHLKTRRQFLADLAVSLGGYVAEDLVFGDVSTGASNDLREASDLARRLVTKYGMSRLGPVTFGKTEELIFLGREIATEKNYSEDVAEKIDKEVASFVEGARKTAKTVLTKHRKALDAVAEALLEKETLEQEAFYAIIKKHGVK